MTDQFSKEETYIRRENSEISIGEEPGWVDKLKGSFPAFSHRNYQLYFSGQLVSLIGTWLQNIALGWLVLQLTNSSFWVGAITALTTLPVLIFALFGGVIVDHFPKKKILILTQSLSLFLALILGVLTVFHKINLIEMGVLALALGAVTAIDAPARQSFVVEMVGKESLSSAIALNSAIFNGARIVGPAFAGFLIAIIGSGGAFILNGISFIGVIIALGFIRVKENVVPHKLHPIEAIKEGLRYSFSNSVIKTLLIFATVSSIFGWSYTTIMPVIAQNVFHIGAAGLGYLNALAGLGALLGTVLVSVFSGRLPKLFFILGGSFLFSSSLLLFSFTTNLILALVFLFFSGMGLLSQFSVVNSTIQHLVDDSYRGRVMSIYTLMFMGMIPIGSFQIGIISEHLGPMVAIRIGAIIIFLTAITIFIKRDKFLDNI
jgi:MFS family permease